MREFNIGDIALYFSEVENEYCLVVVTGKNDPESLFYSARFICRDRKYSVFKRSCYVIEGRSYPTCEKCRCSLFWADYVIDRELDG